MVPLLGKQFPERIWTRYESEQFKNRFGEGSVIPVWFSDVPPSAFGEDRAIGGIVFDVDADIDGEARRITDLLAGKIRDRLVEVRAAAEEPEPLFETP